MANFGSTIFFVFAFMGFGTFMPKYNSTFQPLLNSTNMLRTLGTLSTSSVQKLQAQRELLDWQGQCQRWVVANRQDYWTTQRTGSWIHVLWMDDREVQVFCKVSFIKILGLVDHLESRTLAAWNVVLGCSYFCTLMVFASVSQLLHWTNLSLHFPTAWMFHFPHVRDPEGVRRLWHQHGLQLGLPQ